MEFHNKKVLVMGLGSLGGGIATAKWLVKHGAKVAVTDLRNKRELGPSLKTLGDTAKKIRMALGGHRETDFRTHDVIVVNPAVPRESKFLKIAHRAGKQITNDAGIFFDLAPNPVIAVTGTRGKTTTTNWIAHFLRAGSRGVAAAGNIPERPLLEDLDRLIRHPETPAVLELSSWQLERVESAKRAADVAIITNIYPDHLNRYRTIEEYARAKALIFKNQNPAQALVLNAENRWTPFLLKMKPRGRIYFFSTNPLPAHAQGLFCKNGTLIFREAGVVEMVTGPAMVTAFIRTWGMHNLENLLAAMLATRLSGTEWRTILARVPTLPSVPYRQEIVIRRKGVLVINDSAGTSPDATIAALRRFGGNETYLITGGTDKKLEFRGLANVIKQTSAPARTFFLSGTATKKLLKELDRIRFFKGAIPQSFEDLPSLLTALTKELRTTSKKQSATVLFSPGAASFEKFKNEFDRGNQFSRAAKRLF
ncbi:MAG: UDP-N-acetylmuramoyl-L-alanine--D-glutamate ligase [Candidatus Brennerbacteria bacterium]